MIKKIIFNFILILLIIVLQLSFINNFFSPIKHFNLVLSILIFIALIFNYNLALIQGLIIGFILDVVSMASFGQYLMAIFITLFMTNLLLNSVFTNKSMYTLMSLGVIGTILYNFLIWFFKLAAFYFKLTDLKLFFTKFTLFDLGWQVVLNLIFLTLCFIIIWFTSNILKSQFLSRKSAIK